MNPGFFCGEQVWELAPPGDSAGTHQHRSVLFSPKIRGAALKLSIFRGAV